MKIEGKRNWKNYITHHINFVYMVYGRIMFDHVKSIREYRVCEEQGGFRREVNL